MSMLAEPRRKKRTINLRRDNEWSQDQNKFGQKLMEKMGWAPGKGLGANENGNTDHVKVKFKDDAGGIGYKDRNDQWTGHDQSFNELLQNLHGGAVDASKLHSETSLEEKSKKLQSRLHYKKFTRGKDITKYSEKDLANIFGKKSLIPDQKPQVEEPEEPQVEKSEENGYDLISAGSMNDYFKSKMKGIKICEKEEKVSEDSESECAFKGFSGTKTSGFSFYPPPEESIRQEEPEKKKKKKKRQAEEVAVNDSEEVVKKKKKKKKQEDVEVQNSILETCDTATIDENRINTDEYCNLSSNAEITNEKLANKTELENSAISSEGSLLSAIKNNKKRKQPIKENDNSSKCDINKESLIKLIKSSDNWELEQIKKMLEDPYLPTIRRELLNNRVLEWYDDLIKNVLNSFSDSDSDYLQVFESLTTLSENEDLKLHINFILKSLQDKIVSQIENQLDKSEVKCIEICGTLEKLLSLSHVLQNKDELCDKINETQKKLLKIASKKFNPCLPNSIELLDEINMLSKKISSTKKRSKIFTNLFCITRSVVMKNVSSDYKHLNDVLEKLKNLKQADAVDQQVKNATSLVQTSSIDLMKQMFIEIKEDLMSCSENVLSFQGTNLDFIMGYDSGPKKYVRCVQIWNRW